MDADPGLGHSSTLALGCPQGLLRGDLVDMELGHDHLRGLQVAVVVHAELDLTVLAGGVQDVSLQTCQSYENLPYII